MNIKRNVIFSLENRKKNGKAIVENVPIRMRVGYLGKRVDFSTGYRIDAKKWDKEKQRVKNNCTSKLNQSASEINADLLQYFIAIQDIFKLFEVEDCVPTPKQLRDAFISKTGKETNIPVIKTSLLSVFDEFTEENGKLNNWTPATYQKFAALKNHLIDFDKDLSFKELSIAKLNEFVCFLRSKKNMRNSTIGKQLGFLKWFLRWTVSKGYMTNTDFQTFKPKLKKTQKKVIFLNSEELTKLQEYRVSKNKQYLERVCDVFLFCCFTGLRYSDVCNLRRSDVKDEHIEVTTVKTADNLIIELNKHSKRILEKYKDIPFENDKVLPVISNQRMNNYLKELAELAGIDEPIRETYYQGNKRIDRVMPKYALLGTHAGRRTFICNALSLGISAQVVMKWTGHSDYKSMKPYIDIADNIKANAMEKFNLL